MEAQVWTLIGLLGGALFALFGLHLRLGGRIEDLGTRLDSRIDGQGAELREADRAILEAVAEQGADIRGSIEGLGAELRAGIDSLNGRFAAHLERHAAGS